MSRRYPLAALQQQREHTKQRKASELASAGRHVVQMTEQHQRAKSARELAQGEAASQQDSETERLGGGLARAADLNQQAQFAAQTRAAALVLQEREKATADALATAVQVENNQRAILADAAASAKAVNNHRNDWNQAEARRAQGRDDSAAEEQWLARFPGTGKQ